MHRGIAPAREGEKTAKGKGKAARKQGACNSFHACCTTTTAGATVPIRGCSVCTAGSMAVQDSNAWASRTNGSTRRAVHCRVSHSLVTIQPGCTGYRLGEGCDTERPPCPPDFVAPLFSRLFTTKQNLLKQAPFIGQIGGDLPVAAPQIGWQTMWARLSGTPLSAALRGFPQETRTCRRLACSATCRCG